MKDYEVVFLEITSYRSSVPSASHVFGTMVSFDVEDNIFKKDLKRKIDQHQADLLNKRETDNIFAYKDGEMTDRFDSLQDLKNTAISVLISDERYSDVKLLLVGHHSVASPLECLWALDETIKEKINDLWRKSNHLYNPTITEKESKENFHAFRTIMDN